MNKYFSTTDSLICKPEGKLDIIASDIINNELKQYELTDYNEVVIDLQNVIYISSSFLRIIAGISSTVGKEKIKIINVNASVMKVLEIVNFKEICQIS